MDKCFKTICDVSVGWSRLSRVLCIIFAQVFRDNNMTITFSSEYERYPSKSYIISVLMKTKEEGRSEISSRTLNNLSVKLKLHEFTSCCHFYHFISNRRCRFSVSARTCIVRPDFNTKPKMLRSSLLKALI